MYFSLSLHKFSLYVCFLALTQTYVTLVFKGMNSEIKVMRKFLKYFGVFIILAAVLLYCAFLFVLPKAVDLNKFKPDIINAVKEQTGLNFNFENPVISVSPLLAAGIKTDDITLKLNDGSEVFTADSAKVRISLPALLFLTVRVSTAEIDNPSLNIDIVNGNSFKAITAFEEILNKKDEALQNAEYQENTPQPSFIDPEKIKIVVPAFILKNYNVDINDLKTGDFLRLKGDELVLSYNNAKTARIKTNAEFFLNDNQNISADIDIDTFLPEVSKLDNEDDKEQRVNLPFVNPVAMYKAYNLKADISSKLKIRTKKSGLIYSYGFFNIDNFSIMLSGLKLPESYFHIKTRHTKADVDTKFYITDKEALALNGKFNYSKRPFADFNLKTDEIHTDNLIVLVKSTLDSLHIHNELDQIKGYGNFVADFALKTNFKKLKSSGFINVNDVVIKNAVKKSDLFKLKSHIVLDDNMLNIKDTFAEIAKTVIKIAGSIDNKSMTDLKLVIENLPLERIFTLLPSDINNTYKVNSGYVDLSASVTGVMKKAITNMNLSLNNLSITDRISKAIYSNKLLVAEFTGNSGVFTGNIRNEDFNILYNGVNIACKDFLFDFGEKDITISPSKIRINKASEIDFEGFVKNYAKKPVIDFAADGLIKSSDLKQLAGSELAMYIDEKGMIPVSLSIKGNDKKQTLKFALEADKDNYITPVVLENTFGKNTVIQSVIDFKGDRLKIKDTGFFIKTVVPDEKNPEKTVVKLTEIAGVDGTVTKLNTSEPNINLLKIKIPSELKGKLFVFPESEFKAKGHAFVFGAINDFRIRGGFNIYDMKIPELFLSADAVNTSFEGKEIYIDFKNILADNSDYNVLISTDINPSKYFTIKNINITSENTDVDRLMKVSDAAMKYVPQTPEASVGSSTAQNAEFPVVVRKGNARISKIKTGNIILANTTSNISLNDAVLLLSDINTSAFEGTIGGAVGVNLLTSHINAALNGTGLNVEKTLYDAAQMKDTLSGTMDFDTDITFFGATDAEIMKNLKGVVNFTMKDGGLGPFGKLENLIMAENIRESSFFQSTIGSVINSLLSFNTTKYNTLSGHLSFEDGIAKIDPITSSGDIMATHIFGTFNLLENTIDVKFRGRLGSQVSDSMGPLALLNPVNLIKATPGMSIVLGKIFFLFTECVTQEDMDNIPALGKDISDLNTTKFQVVLRGNVAKPFSLVKSFKWLALQSDIDKAQNYVEQSEAEEAARLAEEEARAKEEAKPFIIKSFNKSKKNVKNFFEKIKSGFCKKEAG